MPLALILIFATQAVAQTPFWARCLPGPEREIWVYGRDLWSGPEKVAQSAEAIIEPSQGGRSFKLTFDNLHGSNDQDSNRGLPYLQRFTVPSEVTSGEYILRHTRNDGKPSAVGITICDVESPRYLLNGPVRELSEPLIIKSGTTYDGDGEVLMPAINFPKGKALVVMQSRSRLQCVHIVCREGTAPAQAVSVESPSFDVRISHVRIMIEGTNKYGIFLRGARNALLDDVHVCAARSVESNPGDWPEGNTFRDCLFSSPRQCADGQIGRGIGGRHCLYLRCHWRDIDRGPTLSPQGYPIDRSVWWECSQTNTGVSEGASEGLLAECKKLALADVVTTGQSAAIAFTHDGRDYCKPGYFVFLQEPTNPRFARIVSADLIRNIEGQARGYRVVFDRDLGNIVTKAYVGNAQVECAYLRCRFWNGKSGIWFWGASQSNAVVNCDFRDLDFGILTMERDRPPGDVGFSRGLIFQHNRFRRVGEERKVAR